jgi:hypothetical protein
MKRIKMGKDVHFKFCWKNEKNERNEIIGAIDNSSVNDNFQSYGGDIIFF